MIRSFRCGDTEQLFAGKCPRRFRAVRKQAERKLIMLHSAETLEFLRSSPGNQLDKPAGMRRGTWSIRINDQWRVCFEFRHGDAFNVEIIDCH